MSSEGLTFLLANVVVLLFLSVFFRYYCSFKADKERKVISDICACIDEASKDLAGCSSI